MSLPLAETQPTRPSSLLCTNTGPRARWLDNNRSRKEAGMGVVAMWGGVRIQAPRVLENSRYPVPGATDTPLPASLAPCSHQTRAIAPSPHTWAPASCLARAGLGSAGRKWGGPAGSPEFPGETAGPALGGFQLSGTGSSEFFRRHLPLPPLSSRSVASMAFMTKSCSSNMTPRRPTSCSWCARPGTSRRAIWWRWYCLVRGGGWPRGGPRMGRGLWRRWDGVHWTQQCTSVRPPQSIICWEGSQRLPLPTG